MVAKQDRLSVQQVREGTLSAFDDLVARHHGVVYAIAYARLQDADAAEDLAQEVFLRAWLQLAAIRDGAMFGAWVARMARNLAVDWHRRGATRSRLVPMVPMDAEAEAQPDERQTGARERMMAEEEHQRLREAIKGLPPEDRELVYLHYMEGLDKAEAAARLGIHPSTAGRRLEKAIAALKDELLRDAVAPLRARPKAVLRTASLVAAAAALPAASKAAVLQAAAQSAPAAATASGATGTIAVTVESMANVATGVFGMTASKMILGTVAAVAIAGGSAYYVADAHGMMPPAMSVRAAANSVPLPTVDRVIEESSLTPGMPVRIALAQGERVRINFPEGSAFNTPFMVLSISEDGAHLHTQAPDGTVQGGNVLKPNLPNGGAVYAGFADRVACPIYICWKPTETGNDVELMGHFDEDFEKTFEEEHKAYARGDVSIHDISKRMVAMAKERGMAPQTPEFQEEWAKQLALEFSRMK